MVDPKEQLEEFLHQAQRTQRNSWSNYFLQLCWKRWADYFSNSAIHQSQWIRRNSWSNYLLHQFLFSLSEIANPHWNASVSVGIHHLQSFHQKMKKRSKLAGPGSTEWKVKMKTFLIIENIKLGNNSDPTVRIEIFNSKLFQCSNESDTIHLQSRHLKGRSPRHNLL